MSSPLNFLDLSICVLCFAISLQNFVFFAQVKKHDKKLASAFTVTPKAKAKWDIAVEEAEISLRRTRYLILVDGN